MAVTVHLSAKRSGSQIGPSQQWLRAQVLKSELPELRSVCFGVEGRNLMWAEDEEEAEEVQELEWLMEDAAAVLHWL